MNETNRLMTITELARHERFKGFTQRQIEYAIQQHGIEPTDRLGIIRAFSADQIEQIAAALQAIQGPRFPRRAHPESRTSKIGGDPQ